MKINYKKELEYYTELLIHSNINRQDKLQLLDELCCIFSKLNLNDSNIKPDEYLEKEKINQMENIRKLAREEQLEWTIPFLKEQIKQYEEKLEIAENEYKELKGRQKVKNGESKKY